MTKAASKRDEGFPARTVAPSSGEGTKLARRAVTLGGLKWVEESIATAKRAVAAAPNNPEVRARFGAVLHDGNRYEEAIAECNAAIEVGGTGYWAAFAHMVRGGSLIALNRYKEGAEAYKTAVETDVEIGHAAVREFLFLIKYRATPLIDDALIDGKLVLSPGNLKHVFEAAVLFQKVTSVFIDYTENERNGKPVGNLVDRLYDICGILDRIEANEALPYNTAVMPSDLLDLNTALRHVARNLGRPVATVRAQLGVGDAKPETTARVKAKPRARANPQLRVARLKAAYEVLVRESNLADPKLPDDERLRRSANLRNTYDRLHKLDPSFHDNSEQLRLARNLLNRRAYQRGKTVREQPKPAA